MEFDFNKNLVVDSLDPVPPDFQGLYVEADGKFKLNTEDVTVGSAVKAITGLAGALTKARGDVQTLQKARVNLGALRDFGDTPDSILEAFNTKIKELEKAGKGKASEDVEKAVEAAKTALREAHAKELEGRETRITGLTSQLYKHLVTAEANSALTFLGAIDPDLARPHLENQIQVAEEDGEFRVSVIDPKTKDPRYGPTGNPMALIELVTEMKSQEKYAPLFKSDSLSGGGKPPGGDKKRVVTSSKEQMSSTDKIAAGIRKQQHTRG
jgi:hypothetical protein